MEEILQILPQAWTGEPFTHQGAVYDLPTLGVRPRPSARIPIVIGGGAEPAIRRAARLADGLFSNAPVDEFVEQVRWVVEECDRIDRDPSTFRFTHYSVLLPAASREEALARYGDAGWAMSWKYSDMEASATRALPPPAPPPFNRPADALLKRRTTMAGRPDEIVESLLELRQRVAVPVEFVARSHLPMIGYDEQIELMQQLAEAVAPHI